MFSDYAYCVLWCIHLYAYMSFLSYHEHRSDLVRIPDIILQRLPLVDTHSLITWVMVLFYIRAGYDLYIYQENLLLYLHNFACLTSVRMVMMVLCPLKAPIELIRTPDIWDHCTGTLVNDLFFSGHVSSITLFYFQFPEPWFGYLLISFIVGILMLLCRMHYSIDILVAPFISYAVVAYNHRYL
jgi:hypothetical protein